MEAKEAAKGLCDPSVILRTSSVEAPEILAKSQKPEVQPPPATLSDTQAKGSLCTCIIMLSPGNIGNQKG